jgi:chromosome segregation ATPase
MTMGERPTWQPPAWLQRILFGTLPPDESEERPDPLATLRQEFQDAIATERTARQILAAELGVVKASAAETERDLARTQKELDLSRDYGKQQARTIALMESTIKSLQTGAERNTAELTSLLGSNGSLQEALRRLEADHKIDQETIAMMRERMKAMEAEIVRLTDINAQYVGTNAGKQLAIDELNKRLGVAIDRLSAAGLSTEGLL